MNPTATVKVPRPAHVDATLRRGAALALLLLYALLYLAPLGVRPLASPDEVRYGEIPVEMMTTGDWITPRFNGVRYFEKPVLGYWLNAASLALFGETPFALRLPVALATGLTALIVYALTRRYASLFAARLAAGIYLTTFLVAGIGTYAVLDPFLALFLTGALASYFRAVEDPSPFKSRAYLAVCGAMCGAAFLVKGFLAFALPVIVVAPYLVARRRWRTLFTSPWLPMAVAALVILPWAVAIQLREPNFWHYFFWVEHIRRFAGDDAQHARPVWFFLASLPLAGLPWILLLPAALLGFRRAPGTHVPGTGVPGTGVPGTGVPGTGAPGTGAPGTGRRAALLGYSAAWALVPFLFLSLSRGKLLTYILPCFPPLSILLAAGLERYFATTRQAAFRAAAAALAAALLAVLAALVMSQSGAFGAPVFGTDELPKLAAFAGFMSLGAGCAAFAALAHGGAARLAALMAAGAALILPLQVTVPQRVLDRVAPSTLIRRYAHPAPGTAVVSDAPLFGAAAWTLRRNDVYVLSAGEIEYGLSYPDSRYRRLDNAALVRLIEANEDRHAILIVCEADTEARFAALLPPSARRSQHGQVILWRIPASRSSPLSDVHRDEKQPSVRLYGRTASSP